MDFETCEVFFLLQLIKTSGKLTSVCMCNDFVIEILLQIGVVVIVVAIRCGSEADKVTR